MCGDIVVAILCAFCILHGAFGDSVMFHDCQSDYDLIDVDISGCDALSCVLEIRSEVNLTIVARATFKSGDVLDSNAIITQMGVAVSQVVTPIDVCQSSANCPIPSGANINIGAVLEVSSQHSPDADCMLKWEIYDRGQMILCFETGVQLIRANIVND